MYAKLPDESDAKRDEEYSDEEGCVSERMVLRQGQETTSWVSLDDLLSIYTCQPQVRGWKSAGTFKTSLLTIRFPADVPVGSLSELNSHIRTSLHFRCSIRL